MERVEDRSSNRTCHSVGYRLLNNSNERSLAAKPRMLKLAPGNYRNLILKSIKNEDSVLVKI